PTKRRSAPRPKRRRELGCRLPVVGSWLKTESQRPAAGSWRASMPRLILLNKPFDVLCQFTGPSGRATLADYVPVPGVYAAGRLDADSERLVVLTADGALQHWIADPRHKRPKAYWVQVEGSPDEAASQTLREGVLLKDGSTRPARAEPMDPPAVWPRVPPIRERKSI